jgi:hypothetical protein
MLREILEGGIHGLAFSPYLEGQGPEPRWARPRFANG